MSSLSESEKRRKWNTIAYFETASAKEVMEDLMAGANANARDADGWSPLHFAASFCVDPEVPRALIQAGADVTAKTGLGSTPLHLAALSNEQIPFASLLIEAGADLEAEDAYGSTPLYRAAFEDKAEMVMMLYLEGASREKAEADGLIKVNVNVPPNTGEDDYGKKDV